MKGPPIYQDWGDSQLLSHGRAGNEDAFLTLYHRHSMAVLRFALHMSGSREVAEEVVQEVFLALLADGATYQEERGSMEPFLIGVARNQVRRQQRDARRNDVTIQDSAGLEATESFCTESELETLRKAIVALPENYRAVTVLCELQQLSYAEAAQRLGCAIGTVRSRLHRAKAILETKLRRREQCRATTAK